MHSSFHVPMSHGFHHSSQVPSSHQDPSAVVMPRAVEDQVFGKSGLRASLAKQSIYRPDVPTGGARGWEDPAVFLRAAALSQNFEGSPTHRNKPSPSCSLAVWYKDEPVLPIEILNAHPVEFALISHSGIAHQDDDVTKEFVRSLSPFAASRCSQPFSFRVIIQT